MSDRSFTLAVDLRGTGAHPHAWRRQDSRAEDIFGASFWTDSIRSADAAGIDIVFLGDSFAEQGLEAAAIAARAAALTSSIGLVPTVTVTHTEPFHVSKQIASLDFATLGRAGWEVAVSPGAQQAKSFGRKGVQDQASLWREADDAVEVVTRLWDSWEDDAEIRDAATGRFIDRDKLHYIDFESDNFSVKGPSITPRSPQGQPPVTVRVDSDVSEAVAANRADIVRIAAPTVADAAESAGRVRRAIVSAGRDPQRVHVLLDVEFLVSATAANDLAQLDNWAGAARLAQSVAYIGEAAGIASLIAEIEQAGLDGVTFVPIATASGIVALTAEVVPSLDRPAVDRPAVRSTLRDRLGLERPVNRYAVQAHSTKDAS